MGRSSTGKQTIRGEVSRYERLVCTDLSSDKYSENDLSVGSYAYSFNNPLILLILMGDWPELPSWKF
jgi:hypothetical protein